MSTFSFKLFIKLQLFIGFNLLFFIVLFHLLNTLYSNVLRDSSDNILKDINKTTASELRSTVNHTLSAPSFKNVLYNYSVFFYLDDYSKRLSFFNYPAQTLPSPKLQVIKYDSFQQEMSLNHKKDLCFVKNTTTISQSSALYLALNSTKDIKEDTYYISCPLIVNDLIVGYLAGLHKSTPKLLYIPILPIKNAATLIENVFVAH